MSRIDVLLVCGGRYHDFDYARLELLKHLGADPRWRVRIAEDYSNRDALAAAQALVTYTCDVAPAVAETAALAAFVARGGRWFALHGTNSLIEFQTGGRINAPRTHPEFMRLLGSQFIAHPPIGDFDIEVTEPDHPLVRGIGRFRVNDEPYLCEMHGENRVLLHMHFNGRAQRGFIESDWFGDAPRPVMYLHAHGDGEVLYLTPGHCRGRYDMRPLMEEYPKIERCSWESPVYHELLRRGLRWATRTEP
jgi:hypothetical protein